MEQTTLEKLRRTRAKDRSAAGLAPGQTVPFTGADIWTMYDATWLNRYGKPQIALLRWVLPSQSAYTFERAALQGYFANMAMQHYGSENIVQKQLSDDLSEIADTHVSVEVISPDAFEHEELCSEFDGISLDRLFIDMNNYSRADASALQSDESQQPHTEVLTSNLLAFYVPERSLSNEKQMALGSIRLEYIGAPIDHASLLRYLVSYRQACMPVEACIERIYMDVMRECKPLRLFVYGRFSRQHGMDVNPLRSSASHALPPMQRLARQ